MSVSRVWKNYLWFKLKFKIFLMFIKVPIMLSNATAANGLSLHATRWYIYGLVVAIPVLKGISGLVFISLLLKCP